MDAAGHVVEDSVPEQLENAATSKPNPSGRRGKKAPKSKPQGTSLTVPSDPPHALEVNHMQHAVERLVALGLPQEEAQEALRETEQLKLDEARWLEEALLVVVKKRELKDEIENLAEGMKKSRDLAQEAELRQLPLKEQPQDQLRTRFAGSELLPLLYEHLSAPEKLWFEPYKEPLVDYLELERKCTELWYRGEGTRRYFQALAGSCCSLLRDCSAGPDAAHPLEQKEGEEEEARGTLVQNSSASTSTSEEAPQRPHRGGESMGDPACSPKRKKRSIKEVWRGPEGACGSPNGEGPPRKRLARGNTHNEGATTQRPTEVEGDTGLGPLETGPLEHLRQFLLDKVRNLLEVVARLPSVPGGIPEEFRTATVPSTEGGGEEEEEDVIFVGDD